MSQRAYTSGSPFPDLTKGTLRIYGSRICPYVGRVRLVLAHKNIPHDLVNIHLWDKPEWFLKVAPLGKVPVLQHDDVILYESTAVAEYLDDVYSGDRLQEDDPYKKARDRILLEYLGQVTSPYYSLFSAIEGNQPVGEGKEDSLLKALQFYEDQLATRDSKFFGGSQPKMIDFYLWPSIERIPPLSSFYTKVDFSKSRFPKLTSWWDAMVELPAVKKDMFSTGQHIELLKIKKEGKSYVDFGLKE